MEIKIVIDDRMIDLGKKLALRRTLAIMALLSVAVPVVLYADVEHIFVAGETISASAVNDNFASLDERVGAFESALSVDGNGYVGIGTTEPTAKLDVAGNVYASGGLTVSGTATAENINQRIWSTGTDGTYNLIDIFDDARSDGLPWGVYDCVLRTSNGGHWTGRRFTASIVYYIGSSEYPHRFYDVVDVAAHPWGCPGGLTSFDEDTGEFTFTAGACYQIISLVCNRLF